MKKENPRAFAYIEKKHEKKRTLRVYQLQQRVHGEKQKCETLPMYCTAMLKGYNSLAATI